MNTDCKKALARLSKICRENISAFGDSYDPRYPSFGGIGKQMKGAKSEGNGVVDMAKEILVEIKSIRRDNRKIKSRKAL